LTARGAGVASSAVSEVVVIIDLARSSTSGPRLQHRVVQVLLAITSTQFVLATG
jgi:hypothetical protein